MERKWHDGVVRVLVCDEFSLFRRQLVVALEKAPDIEVLAEAPDADVAMAVSRQMAPDVVFLGARFPPEGGARAAARMREAVPLMEFALAIDPDNERDDRELSRAVYAGVIGFLPRDEVGARAVLVARALAARRPVVDARVAMAVLVDYSRSLNPSRGAQRSRLALEPRERSVLEALAAGASLPQVADDLAIPHTTASNLVANALQRLHRHARNVAVARSAGSGQPGG